MLSWPGIWVISSRRLSQITNPPVVADAYDPE
jgi:hypothetical protein